MDGGPIRRRRAARAVGVTVVALALLATGCRSRAAVAGGIVDDGPVGTVSADATLGATVNNTAPRMGGTLDYGLYGETNGYNPATNQWSSAGLTVARTIFDNLVTFDDRGEIRPFLAESLVPDADFTRWTVKLRPGVRLHNGKPVNAALVKANQDHLRQSPITKGCYYWVDGFDVVDDLTLVVRTRRWATFPQAMAAQIGVVADQEWLASNDGRNPIGTGPFRYDGWDIGRELRVKKNPDYWRSDTHGNRYPYVDAINFEIVVDDAQRTAMLRAGDLDLAQLVDPDEIRAVRERARAGELQYFSDVDHESPEDLIYLNTMQAPLADVDARRALAHATDRAAYAQYISGGLYEPAESAYARNSRWHHDVDYPGYDPARARVLVEQVKARHGGRFEFVLRGSSAPRAQKTMQYLAQAWAAVGMDVRIEGNEQQRNVIRMVTGDFAAMHAQHFEAATPTADAIFWFPEEARPLKEFSLNFARLKDDELARAVTDAMESPTLEAHQEAVGRIARRHAELVPYLWLAHLTRAVAAHRNVVNVVGWTLPDGSRGLPFMQGSHTLHQVWIDA